MDPSTGAYTLIDVAGLWGSATDVDTQPSGVNNQGEMVGAYGYGDAVFTGDGFYRSKDGDYYQVVVPGAVRTVAIGITEGGLISGYCEDTGGHWIAFVAKAADVIVP